MRYIKRLLFISRPRFWMYEFATFVCFGLLAGYASLDGGVSIRNVELVHIVWAIYFLFPANLLIYGINDIYDYDTDKNNPKKIQYESLVTPSEAPKIFRAILYSSVPFIVLVFFTSKQALIPLGLFFFFAVFYSAYPIRAKIRPFIDAFFSAGHYVATGVFGYVLVTMKAPSISIVVSGFLWAYAMHAFSAVPDIAYDKEAKLETIATKLGYKRTLLFCGICFLLSGVLFALSAPIIGVFWSVFYFLVMKNAIENQQILFYLYKQFPILNALCGMTITLWIILTLF